MEPSELCCIFADFVKEARRLQDKYKDKISLIVGFETDVIRKDCFERIKTLKKDLELDYIVGSIHHVDGIPTDISLELYEKAEKLAGGTELLMCRYYDQQYQLLLEVKPEVIGHFDLIRLYRPDFEFTDIIWRKIVRNVDFGISYGALFEINTSGASSSKKLKNPHPHKRVLEVSEIWLCPLRDIREF